MKLGRVLDAAPIWDAFGPATLLRLDDGSLVVCKALPTSAPGAEQLQRQHFVGAHLPRRTPSPPMRWSTQTDDWVIVVHDHVTGRRADLTPGSPDLPIVVSLLRQLSSDLADAPTWTPAIGHDVEAFLDRSRLALYHAITSLSQADQAMYTEALADFTPGDMDGHIFTHFDLCDRTIVITPEQKAQVIGWSYAARATLWAEAAMLAIHLIEAGHSPTQVETLLAEVPGWLDARRKTMAGLAAVWTLARIGDAVHGPEALRSAQAVAANAGRRWFLHCTSKALGESMPA